MRYLITVLLSLYFLNGCTNVAQDKKISTFKDTTEFLQQYTQVHVLKEGPESRVLVCPEMQARVMTSTAEGPDGLSYGWVNYEYISSGIKDPHFNAAGGEERLWLGPEGGQYSIFFAQDTPFDLDHWYTPPEFNSEAWNTLSVSEARIHMQKEIDLTNYSGTSFDLKVDRVVQLLNGTAIDSLLQQSTNNLKTVAYQSVNTIQNTGDNAWAKDSGLLSIWILGMFNPSPATNIVIPYQTGPEAELGPIVNDVYFGAIPKDRLKIDNGKIFFKADGKQRGKIGFSPQRCIPKAGSYDAANNLLTLVTFSFDPANADYVNSLWEIQEKPYAGDVLNSYNDGPTEPGGKPLGPFYELESSSPAAALEPGESMVHTHTTIHITGNKNDLDAIAKSFLGVGIEQIQTAFR